MALANYESKCDDFQRIVLTDAGAVALGPAS